MKELEAKLNELKAKQEELQEHSFATVERLSGLDVEIEAVKAQLAEAKKPKLRHGDYGYNYMNRPCMSNQLHDGHGNKLEMSTSSDAYTYVPCGGSTFRPSPVLGNIFDDLKAMQENVTEHTPDLVIEHVEPRLGEQYIDMGVASYDGEFYINTRSKVFHASEKELKEIHTFIGRRLATLKRQQK